MKSMKEPAVKLKLCDQSSFAPEKDGEHLVFGQ